MAPRPRILCLGVSYADLDQYIDYQKEQELWNSKDNGVASARRRRRCSESNADYPETLVTKVLECMSSNRLNQMDGRDTCRCVATEEFCDVDVYTVSQELAAKYRSDRHLHANFNRSRAFMEQLVQTTPLNFEEIILDYFWIPAGWNVQHWSRSFFAQTLVDMHKLHVIRLPATNGEANGKDKTHGVNGGDDSISYDCGKIYLPFCHHVFQQVLSCRKQLLRYYHVEFLRTSTGTDSTGSYDPTNELNEIHWWRGTQQIDPTVMQNILHKRMDQENVYCRFGLKSMHEAEHDRHISKETLLKISRQLEDFGRIRFLKLVPVSEAAANGPRATGKIRGLVDPSQVVNGIDQMEEEEDIFKTNKGSVATNNSYAVSGMENTINNTVPTAAPARKAGKKKMTKKIATSTKTKSRPVSKSSSPENLSADITNNDKQDGISTVDEPSVDVQQKLSPAVDEPEDQPPPSKLSTDANLLQKMERIKKKKKTQQHIDHTNTSRTTSAKRDFVVPQHPTKRSKKEKKASRKNRKENESSGRATRVVSPSEESMANNTDDGKLSSSGGVPSPKNINMNQPIPRKKQRLPEASSSTSTDSNNPPSSLLSLLDQPIPRKRKLYHHHQQQRPRSSIMAKPLLPLVDPIPRKDHSRRVWR